MPRLKERPTFTQKDWRRVRYIMLPLMLTVVVPRVLYGVLPFLLLFLSIGYFVDRQISPESVGRKPFHVKAWLWFKSFCSWCVVFWREGPTDDADWMKRKPASDNSNSGRKTLPCRVCGKPVQLSVKYGGRAKSTICLDCVSKRSST